MNIVHVISGLALGGAEMSLLRLLRAQQPGFQNAVISLRSGGPMRASLEAAGVPVFEVGASSAGATLANGWKILRRARVMRPAIVHGWMYAGNLGALMLRALLPGKARLIWNVRASLEGLESFPASLRRTIQASRTLSRAPDVLVFNSHAGMRQHLDYGFHGGNTRVITNGIDPGQLEAKPGARQRIRAELGLQPATTVICNVARLDPMKDHLTLLRAAARLRDADAHFVLVGPGVTPDCALLRDEIASLQLGGKVSLLGSRSDVADILSAADVFCLSSYTEGLPNAVVEAMACGLPCVVTDVGDAAWLVAETGVVVPPRDPQGLAQGLRAMLAESPARRAARGQAGRERIIREFSLRHMINSYEKLYTELAD
jgi:glycosyltransferase involved in cell wall biosynthesis